MADKESFLKKRLIRDSIIATVILGALGALGFVLMDFDDDYEAQAASTQGELDAMHGEYDSIKSKLGSAYDVQNYYGVYALNHNPNFTLNRDAIDSLLRPIKEKYHIANMTLTISPVSDVTGDSSHIQIGTLVRSDVKLTFGALTDNDVYGMIGALQRTFPGIVIVYNLGLTREGELSKNALVDLGQHKITPFVKGELSFAWLGIRPKPVEPATGDTAHAQ